jgi:proline dehydrogenase
MYGKLLLGAAGQPSLKSMMTRSRLSEKVVARFVAGETIERAVAATRRLHAEGLRVTLDHLGEDISRKSQADATAAVYRRLIEALTAEGLADGAEISVKLSALGQSLGPDGPRASTERARGLVAHAAAHGIDVTFDMEDHTTVDHTLSTVRELRLEHPRVGCVIQTMLLRTDADARELAHPGSRVRVVKGAYAENTAVAFGTRQEVDEAYVRCVRTLSSDDDRAAILLRAAELLAGPWRDTAQRGDDARAVEDGVPGRDRRRVRADRLLALQRPLRAGRSSPSSRSRTARRLEPHGPPPARGLRLRDHAVQLHRDRRQPADRAGADGQHGDLEAVADAAVSAHWTMRLLEEAGLPPGVINMLPGNGREVSDVRSLDRPTWPASTSPARPRRSSTCGRRSARTSPLPLLPAHRRRDRRQGLRHRAPVGRPGALRSRSSAARSSTRGRSARPPPRLRPALAVERVIATDSSDDDRA